MCSGTTTAGTEAGSGTPKSFLQRPRTLRCRAIHSQSPPGRCGIMLIDQGRRDNGRSYKTRNNTIHGNEMTFEGAACAGGVSDTKPDNENFAIITDGNNRFDGNTYRVRAPERTAPASCGTRTVTDWSGFRGKGLEQNGRLVLSER